MHFSIPDTNEVSANKSNNQQSHILFNIHINGIRHCTLRYSQLNTFNTELQRLFPTAMADIDSFPPKKFFSLSSNEIDERRGLLEHYLQSIAQSRHIITSTYFNEFFLNAQIETFSADTLDINNTVNLTICLLNKHELIIENISPKDNTTRLLDACALKIQLKKDFVSYFGLYLYEQKDDQLNLLRPLYDFESPYLSLKQMKQVHQQSCIVLKKSYWDSSFDSELMEDSRARKLLFVQAQYEIEQSQALSPSDIYQKLETLQESSSFKDYISLARTSKFYGYIILKQCSILHPINDKAKQKLCQCFLIIGNKEMICYIHSDKNKEISFKVSRIRCWKVNWTKQDMSISLEYLFRKETLEWIKIHTEQAALVSICLQSIVDEIIAKKTDDNSPPATTAAAVTTVKPSSKAANGLKTRTKSASERLNDNIIFNEGTGDDDL